MPHDILDEPIQEKKAFDRSDYWQRNWRLFNVCQGIVIGFGIIIGLVKGMYFGNMSAKSGAELFFTSLFYFGGLNIGYVLIYFFDVIVFERSKRWISYVIFGLYFGGTVLFSSAIMLLK